jgi:hypothetical protein
LPESPIRWLLLQKAEESERSAEMERWLLARTQEYAGRLVENRERAFDTLRSGTDTFDKRFFFFQPSFYMRSSTAAIVAALACVLWWSSVVEAESGKQVTTHEAAAAVGAKVLPSDPKLKIEPK